VHDVPALTTLYNHYIENTAITFDLEPWTVERRQEWFKQFAETGRHQLVVAESAAGVLGYACSTKFRPKAAYDTTVETTIYVRQDTHRKGLGRALYAELFKRIAPADLHRAVAIITQPNPTSNAFHESFGFRQKGLLDQVGRKFGKYWDVAWYEKPFE
jgi:phosphinothricin acetyltransferase